MLVLQIAVGVVLGLLALGWLVRPRELARDPQIDRPDLERRPGEGLNAYVARVGADRD